MAASRQFVTVAALVAAGDTGGAVAYLDTLPKGQVYALVYAFASHAAPHLPPVEVLQRALLAMAAQDGDNGDNGEGDATTR